MRADRIVAPTEPKMENNSTLGATLETCCPTGTSRRDRIARIKILFGRFRRGTADLLFHHYRLGAELKALRDETPHGLWNTLFNTELAFIGQRDANSFIALAEAFKSEADLTGLNLTEAVQRARKVLGAARARPRQNPRRTGKSYVRRLGAFREYLDSTTWSETGVQLAAQDCQTAIEQLTAIVQAAEKAIRELERRANGIPVSVA